MGKGSAASTPTTAQYSNPNRQESLSPGQNAVDTLMGQATQARLQASAPYQGFMPQNMFPNTGVQALGGNVPQFNATQFTQQAQQAPQQGAQSFANYFNPYQLNPYQGPSQGQGQQGGQ